MTVPSGTPAENPHPAALFGAPGPDGEDDGQQPGHLGDHAVGVLELHPANEFRDFVKEPNEVGQSGTESPASLLVTRAPAMMRRNVQQARTTAKRCSARL